MSAILYYVHDPMCSWCWGFQPQWQALKTALTQHDAVLEIKNVVGGLAKDSLEPMPLSMQQAIQGYWREIQSQLHTEFNFDFWSLNTPRRSTFDSCRATIAITFQCVEVADQRIAQETMIDAIQRAYYLRAMNPSNLDILSQLAQEIGFDRHRFEADMQSEKLRLEFDRQLMLARSLPIDGFPSLVLETQGRQHKIPRDYHSHLPMLSAIESFCG